MGSAAASLTSVNHPTVADVPSALYCRVIHNQVIGYGKGHKRTTRGRSEGGFAIRVTFDEDGRSCARVGREYASGGQGPLAPKIQRSEEEEQSALRAHCAPGSAGSSAVHSPLIDLSWSARSG